MQPAAAAAQPLALDQARCYIQRLLSIINERNAQVELLKTHLDQKTELCNVHAEQAQRAEANATAAREQLLLQQQLDRSTLPSLTPADLAALNTLPPSERDATWLRRVFAARAPLGPYELAGLYLDAFAWTRTAATGSDIVAAVARVFPGVQLVRTGCGLRFRGVVRAGVAPAVVQQEVQARQLRTERTAAALDAYASAAEASSSSRPASPRPPPPPRPIGKRKRSPEPEPGLDAGPTSKRVRTAQGGAVRAEDPLDLRVGVRVLHDVGTSPQRMRAHDAARIPPVENPSRSTSSIATQSISASKTYADAEVQARDTRPALQPHMRNPAFSIGTQTIDVVKNYAEAGVQARDPCPARTYADAGVQACDSPQIDERPPDRDALLADPPAHIPPDLPPLRVPRHILHSTLPDRAVRIVQNLQRGDEDVETFRDDGDGDGGLEYLGTYVLRPMCVGYSRAVHEALARAVLDAEVRVLSRLGVGDSDSECEDGDGGLSDGD